MPILKLDLAQDWDFFFLLYFYTEFFIPLWNTGKFSVLFPYGHILGHRGLTHSLFLGIFASLLISTLLSRNAEAFSKTWFFYFVFFFLVWASHGILDMFTRGGYGAALLWPFDNHRIFSSWSPIPISPIGPGFFFTKRGLDVFKNELLWVWLPSFFLAFFARVVRMIA